MPVLIPNSTTWSRRMTAEEQQWCETLAAVASALKQEMVYDVHG